MSAGIGFGHNALAPDWCSWPVPATSRATVFAPSKIHVPDPPPCNERGEVLLEAGRGQAPTFAPDFVLVLPLDLGRILLVRNAIRRVLELPGGWIDPGETPPGAAARELLEETGHAADALQVAGWLRIRSPRSPWPLTGVVFATRGLQRRLPHAPDQEIESLHWARLSALPGGISAIDAWLVAQFGRR
ncbi:NUDIX hydrolase [Pseudoxanthomonas suwonensis]|jgi:ADP-ribose pyrophosphatase